METPKILVGIITYEPDINRLTENFSEISKQTKDIVIIDNNSSNIKQIEIIHNNIIRNNSNFGVAKALIQLMEYAKANNYDWVLSLDQDSVVRYGLIDRYKSFICNNDDKNVAILTCLINDRNFQDINNKTQNKEVIEVPYCITSGMLCNVQIYFHTSGYDESFFIDCVDFDLCYTFREHGYRIVRMNYIGILHEVGHGSNKELFGRKFIVYNEKTFRVYYIARNYIKLYNKHKCYISFLDLLKKELFILTRIIFYENDKIERLRYFFKGIFTFGK